MGAAGKTFLGDGAEFLVSDTGEIKFAGEVEGFGESADVLDEVTVKVLFKAEDASIGRGRGRVGAVEVEIFAALGFGELDHFPDDEDGGVHFIKNRVRAAVEVDDFGAGLDEHAGGDRGKGSDLARGFCRGVLRSFGGRVLVGSFGGRVLAGDICRKLFWAVEIGKFWDVALGENKMDVAAKNLLHVGKIIYARI